MTPLNDLAVFVAVAETNGFTAAGRRLGSTTSATSKNVGRLEDRLGVRLFSRTTRRVTLTQEGRRFYESVKSVLDELSDAEETIKTTSAGLTGRIRIDLPVLFGRRFVLPLLLEFQAEHPDIDLDIRLSDAMVDIVSVQSDLAIRFGELPDSSLKGRQIGRTQYVTLAAPSYIEKHGLVSDVRELDEHVCATYLLKESGRPLRWRFGDGQDQELHETAQTICVDDGDAYRQIGLSGLAMIQDLAFHYDENIQSVRLVQVLKGTESEGFPISVVYPAGRHQPRRVRTLLDCLVSGLAGFGD